MTAPLDRETEKAVLVASGAVQAKKVGVQGRDGRTQECERPEA